MPQVAKQTPTVMAPSDLTISAIVAFERNVRDAVAGKPDLVRLDCQALERVASNHISLLWESRTLCRSQGIPLRLANPTVSLMRILCVLDLVEVFEYEGANHHLGQRMDRDMALVGLPQSFTDMVRSNSDDINDAIDRFVVFMARLRVSDTTTIELRTLYYEIATNIRIHSGMMAQDQFQVNAKAEADRLTVTFTDPGRPFDPTAVRVRFDAAAASGDRQRRGFGLPMIQRLADCAVYHWNDTSHNTLTITKKWSR